MIVCSFNKYLTGICSKFPFSSWTVMKAGEFDFEMKVSGTPWSSWSWSWSSMLTLERVSAPAQDFIVS